MKILHVITSLGIGGAEILLKDLAIHLNRYGEDVTVIVLLRVESFIPSELVQNGIKIIYCPVNKKISLKNIIFLVKHLCCNHYDIIHAHLTWDFYYLALVKLLLAKKIRLVVSEHSTKSARRNNIFIQWFSLDKIVYSSFEKIICVTEDVRKSLVDYLPSVKNKCVIINNGIDLKRFTGIYKRSNGGHIILCIGTLCQIKDQATLIKAMKLINEAQLWLVGDGPDKNDLMVLVKNLGLQGRVLFLGKHNDVSKLFEKTTIYVQPSRYEGFGIAILEAMAAGLPVIASDVSGWNEAVKTAALFFPAGDEIALAKILNELLFHPDFMESLGNKCKFAASMYNIEKTAESYLCLYKTILFSSQKIACGDNKDKTIWKC